MMLLTLFKVFMDKYIWKGVVTLEIYWLGSWLFVYFQCRWSYTVSQESKQFGYIERMNKLQNDDIKEKYWEEEENWWDWVELMVPQNDKGKNFK